LSHSRQKSAAIGTKAIVPELPAAFSPFPRAHARRSDAAWLRLVQSGDNRAAAVAAAASDFAAAPGKPGDVAPEPGSGGPEIRVAAFAPLPPLSTGAPVDALIAKYARHYDLPEEFVRRVARRESNFNPRAYNRGHWGLMQIKHATARGMGYRGPAEGLFDAETNLIDAVKYLRGAYLVAGGDQGKADRLYQSGYYYHAKRAGLLDETGLGRDRVRKRRHIP
jgi:soluble lytic murein transglycosylase-like protein